jgi:hypothetical protein
MVMPGVRLNQAERRFKAFVVLLKVGTALSADWMRPSRYWRLYYIANPKVNCNIG